MLCNFSYLWKYVIEQVGISECNEKTYLFLSLFYSFKSSLWEYNFPASGESFDRLTLLVSLSFHSNGKKELALITNKASPAW